MMSKAIEINNIVWNQGHHFPQRDWKLSWISPKYPSIYWTSTKKRLFCIKLLELKMMHDSIKTNELMCFIRDKIPESSNSYWTTCCQVHRNLIQNRFCLANTVKLDRIKKREEREELKTSAGRKRKLKQTGGKKQRDENVVNWRKAHASRCA